MDESQVRSLTVLQLVLLDQQLVLCGIEFRLHSLSSEMNVSIVTFRLRTAGNIAGDEIPIDRRSIRLFQYAAQKCLKQTERS